MGWIIGYFGVGLAAVAASLACRDVREEVAAVWRKEREGGVVGKSLGVALGLALAVVAWLPLMASFAVTAFCNRERGE